MICTIQTIPWSSSDETITVKAIAEILTPLLPRD